MKARVAGIAGSVLALTVIGGFAVASTFQSVPAAPAAVVQPAAVETVEPTVAPVVAPTTAAPVVEAPAPVESTQAPVVVAPEKVVVVPKVVQPAAPAPVAPDVQANPNLPHDAAGNVIIPTVTMGGPQSDGHGNPIPTPTP